MYDIRELQMLTDELRAYGASYSETKRIRGTSMYRATAVWKDYVGGRFSSTIDSVDPVAALRDVRDTIIAWLRDNQKLPHTSDSVVPLRLSDGVLQVESPVKVDVGPQRGPKGDTGETGSRGTVGADGPVGPRGALGPKGDRGDPGPEGIQGPRGPQGIQGPQGDLGPTGHAEDQFVFEQQMPSQDWDIVHNLGTVPDVVVVDSGGTVWSGNIVVIDLNHIFIHFDVPAFAGTAYLS